MDQDKELEILDRIRELETRLSDLEQKVRQLAQITSDDLASDRSEIESDDPIIDG